MNLYSGDPYWLTKNGYLFSYPRLSKDIHCDIAIIGGGITGALIAHHLHRAGIKVVIVDERNIGFGSTCASTALLQYEIDTPLIELSEKIGLKNAEESYKLCVKAVTELKKIADSLPINCNFTLKKSLYIASTLKDADTFPEEIKARKRLGIKIKLLESQDIYKTTGIKSPSALLSQTGAQLDPLLFTHGVFQKLLKKRAQVYDRTKIKRITESVKHATLESESGNIITCKKFVFATGYESQKHIDKKIAHLHSTYAIISKPIEAKKVSVLKPYLIWESARPYLYIRTTDDNRIIVGGKDEEFYDPASRDALIKEKSALLQKAFNKKFPKIPFTIDFSWAGTFAETKDGLPYVGQYKKYKHGFFALGFGGNGIVFSQIAAKIITDLNVKGKSEHEKLFSFER